MPPAGCRRRRPSAATSPTASWTEEALRESELQLRQTAQAGNVGLWDWDLRTNRVHYSPEWKRQIGYEEHEIADDFREWQDRVHPDDLEATLGRKSAPSWRSRGPTTRPNSASATRTVPTAGFWRRLGRRRRGRQALPHARRTRRYHRPQAAEEPSGKRTRFRSLFENMLNGFAYCRMIFVQDRPQDFVYAGLVPTAPSRG